MVTVRNVHVSRVAGIRPGQVGQVTEDVADRFSAFLKPSKASQAPSKAAPVAGLDEDGREVRDPDLEGVEPLPRAEAPVKRASARAK